MGYSTGTQIPILNPFTNSLYANIEKVHRESKYCIMLGDFNTNLLNNDTHSPTEFLNNLGSYFFQPRILKPTRITNYSATLIDNIFFNSLEHSTLSGNILSDISDHLPNFLIINKLSILSSKIEIFKRDYSKLDELALIEDVQSIDWQQILPNSKNVDDIFDAFHTSINEVINKHIPIRQLSRKEIKSQAKPWITPAIKRSINIKNKLFANYLKTKSVLTHLK